MLITLPAGNRIKLIGASIIKDLIEFLESRVTADRILEKVQLESI